MKNISILLPIYKLEKEDKIMLTNAVMSVENFHEDVKLVIICPESLHEEIDEFNFGDKLKVIKMFNVTNNTDFTSQINMGIQGCDTEWFSILEIDDEYKEGWAKTAKQYIENYKDVDVFLPIIEDVNVDGKFVGFTNESLWAYGFTEKQGFLDKEILLKYQNYQTSGGLFRTEVIKSNGLFKDNIKLSFTYEFFLRLTNNGVVVMGIPKIGYRHVNFRENSLFWKYKNDDKIKMSDNEITFWLETAKKEYFFKNKRDISYVE